MFSGMGSGRYGQSTGAAGSNYPGGYQTTYSTSGPFSQGSPQAGQYRYQQMSKEEA